VPVGRNALVHRVCFPPDKHCLHLRPTADGGLLLGADDTDALAASASHVAVDADASSAQSLLDRAGVYLPSLSSNEQITARRCLRPMPADGLPIVGAFPGLKGVYLLVTHSGITLGPLLAQLLADEIVTGRISPWLERYRPDRLAK